MILAACEGRGNGEKDAKGLARAERGEGSGRWGGWTGRRGDGQQGGGDREAESGRGQWGGKDGEGSNREGKRVAMERGAMGKGGKMGRGQWEGWKGERCGDGHGEKKGQEISQMDMMGCLGGHRL